VTSDRINLLLDDRDARRLLVAAGVSAVVAVCLSLLALMVRGARVEVALLAGGAAAYVAGLLFAIFAAAGAADFSGHPSITEVAVQPGPPATLSFTVSAGSMDEDQSIAVRIIDAPTADIVYSATMRPDSAGRIEQQVAFPVPAGTHGLVLESWRLDQARNPPDCASSHARVICVALALPG
jgi:hypothetical protein